MTDIVYNSPLILEEATVEESGGRSDFSEFFLAAMIWGPVLLFAILGYLVKQPYISIVALMFGGVIHSVLRPRVSIYMLMCSICLFWLVALAGGGLTSIAKPIGLFAVLVSLPKLFMAISTREKDPAAKWIIVLLLWCLLLTPLSISPIMSLVSITTVLLVYGLPLLFCIHFKDEHSMRILLVILILTGLITAITVLTSEGIKSSLESYTRVSVQTEIGERPELNVLARIMCICLFACIFLLIVSKDLILRGVIVAVSMILVTGIVIAKSRSVYMAGPLSIVGAILLLKGSGVKKRILIILIIALLGVAIIFIGDCFNLWGVGIFQRFQSISLQSPAARARFALWKGYFVQMARSGFIGSGLFQATYGGAVAEYAGKSGWAAHNDIIQIAGDLGIVGLVCFLGLHINLFCRIRRMSAIWHKFFTLTLWLFLIICGMTQTDYYRKFYGLTLAIIFIIIRIDEQRKRVEEYNLSNSFLGDIIT